MEMGSNKLQEVPCEVYGGYMLPGKFSKMKDNIEKLEVYNDDIWVCGYPRSGTTWVQYFVWCLYNRDNLDKHEYLSSVFHQLEYSVLFPQDDKELPEYMRDSVGKVEHAARPRFIKTTLPWDLLPKQMITFQKRPKVLHIVRDPRDTCTSNFFAHKLFHLHLGDFTSFCNRFVSETTSWGPYTSIVRSYYNFTKEENILFLRYEEMVANVEAALVKIAKFLDIKLSEQEVQSILPRLGFEAMKANPLVNKTEAIDAMKTNNLGNADNFDYYRSGKSGNFSQVMTRDMQSIFNETMLTELSEIGLVYKKI